jgi:BarH-like
LELLAEAGNYAAFQRLYGGASPYLGGWPYPPQVPNTASPPSSLDLYYRQAAAAAALQKPLPYRLYAPGTPGINPLTAIPGPSATQFSHLTAAGSISSLNGFYNNNNNNSSKETINNNANFSPRRSPSPQLNPGSPEGRSDSNSQSDNEEETIHV